MSSLSTRPEYTPPLTEHELRARPVTEMVSHNGIYKAAGAEHCRCEDTAGSLQQSRTGGRDATQGAWSSTSNHGTSLVNVAQREIDEVGVFLMSRSDNEEAQLVVA